MCFSVPKMLELIPFDCSRMVLLAEASTKWINLDYLSLTHFDFSKKINFGSLLVACLRDIRSYCSLHICNSYFLLFIKMFAEYSQKEHWIFAAYLIYIFKCMFVAYSHNVRRIFPAYLISCSESYLPHIC